MKTILTQFGSALIIAAALFMAFKQPAAPAKAPEQQEVCMVHVYYKGVSIAHPDGTTKQLEVDGNPVGNDYRRSEWTKSVNAELNKLVRKGYRVQGSSGGSAGSFSVTYVLVR